MATEPAASDRETLQTAITYEGEVRRTLLALGSNDPDADLAASHQYWKHCQEIGIDPEVCAATIYTTVRHKHKDTGHAQTATFKEGAASPTREDWEVVVKRGGISVDDITAAAGRRPSEVTAGNAVFGGFRDDEQATSFARKMTKAGYTASSGPSREYTLHEEAAEDVGILSSADRRRLEKESYAKTAQSHKGKFHGRPAVMVELRPGQAQIKTLDAMTDGELVSYARKHGVKDAHGANEGEAVAVQTVTTAVAVEGDTSAMEVAPVISEAPNACGIPWNKVSRDPKVHASNMELAAKHGAIKTAKDVYALVGPALNKEDQEVFLVIPLNLRGELKSAPYEVARGQRSRVAVDPADVLRAALDAGAEGYLVVHCHPTGKAKPSKADIDLTETLKAATKPYGKSLCILDHVVIGNGEAYSIFEKKMYKC
jgi:DNA repair protein RadC